MDGSYHQMMTKQILARNLFSVRIMVGSLMDAVHVNAYHKLSPTMILWYSTIRARGLWRPKTAMALLSPAKLLTSGHVRSTFWPPRPSTDGGL
jgi:hypothetical protein